MKVFEENGKICAVSF